MKKSEEKNMKKQQKQIVSSFWQLINFMLINGLLGWFAVLFVNGILFCVTLFYSEKALVYMLIFFGISVIGQLIYYIRR